MLLQTVDEWGRKLLVNSLLLCNHNQPGGRKGRVRCEVFVCMRVKETIKTEDMTYLKFSCTLHLTRWVCSPRSTYRLPPW